MLRFPIRLALSLAWLSLLACTGSSAKVDTHPDARAVAADTAPDMADAAPLLADAAQAEDSRHADTAPGVDARSTDPETAPDSAVVVDADALNSPDTRPAGDTQATRDTAAAEASKPVTFASWPGGNAVTNASVKNAFGTNLSGLVYQPAMGTAQAVLWAVQNGPSKVFRLSWNGTAFVPATTDGWGSGKTLVYPNGSGSPDSEGLTRTEWEKNEVYVVAEQNTEVSSTSRLSILRFDLSGTATTMKATHEWNLTSDLPAASDPNKGLEAIAWIPDTFLVARGFYDEASKATYDPAAYTDHGTGIFLVGVEDTGMIYGFAVNHTAGTFKRVATFSSGQAGVMDLAFDRETNTLFSQCDSMCKNTMTLFDIDTTEGSSTKGRFILRATLPPPATLSSDNNEGITMAPESECANNRKGFFWADDDESNGYAIRRDTIPCGRLF